jgi:hypothetical protein
MTESEWYTCADLRRMLDCLPRNISDRKLRLFACACCRRIWELLPDARSRTAIEVAERFVDGLATRQQLSDTDEKAATAALDAYRVVYDAAEAEALAADLPEGWMYGAWECAMDAAAAAHAARDAAAPSELDLESILKYTGNAVAHVVSPLLLTRDCNPALHLRKRAQDTEQAAQAALLRCIVGQPFWHVSVTPSCLTWSDGTVPRIARAIYDERAFDRMPILADALADAGCDNADLLAHCRGPGSHVRGCWVVDLLLGKQ